MSLSRSARLTCGLIGVLLAPVVVRAQASSVQPGARVRVSAPSVMPDRVTGSFVGIQRDTLLLAVTVYRSSHLGVNEDTVHWRIPLRAVTALDTVVGHASNGGTGALVGLGGGGGMGLMMGLIMAGNTCTANELICPTADASGVVLLTAAMGAVGALTGWMIGSKSTHEVWGPVELSPRAAPVAVHVSQVPLGGETIGVGVALRF